MPTNEAEIGFGREFSDLGGDVAGRSHSIDVDAALSAHAAVA